LLSKLFFSKLIVSSVKEGPVARRLRSLAMPARTWTKALEYAALLARVHAVEVVVLTSSMTVESPNAAVEYLAAVEGSQDLEDAKHRGFRPLFVIRPAPRAA